MILLPFRSMVSLLEIKCLEPVTFFHDVFCSCFTLKNTPKKGYRFILSGDDPQTYEFMKRGAVGLVSVAANLVPEAVVSLVNALGDKDYAAALEIHEKYHPLFSDIMSLDTNPVPIKTAVALTGLCFDELRLPLVNLNEDNLAQLKKILADFELV